MLTLSHKIADAIEEAAASSVSPGMTLALLKAACDAARAKADAEPTPENRKAAADAWAAYDAAAPRLKRAGHASHAGQRQARERRSR